MKKSPSYLFQACEKGSPEIVKLLLAHAPKEDLERADEEGHTPLHVASMAGYSAIVTLLLDRKANLSKNHGKSR